MPDLNLDNYEVDGGWGVDPSLNCEANPNSPYCGGLAASTPVGFQFDWVKKKCSAFIRLDTTLLWSNGPYIQIDWQDPNCQKEEEYPFRIPIEQFTERSHFYDTPVFEYPPFNIDPPLFEYPPGDKIINDVGNPYKGDGDDNNGDGDDNRCDGCRALWKAYLPILRERQKELAEQIKRFNTEMMRTYQAIMSSDRAPEKGPSFCKAFAKRIQEKIDAGGGAGAFIAPTAWVREESTHESYESRGTSYLAIYGTPKNWGLRSASTEEGELVSHGRKISDACIIKLNSYSKMSFLGYFHTRHCYAMGYPIPGGGGKVLGTTGRSIWQKSGYISGELYCYDDSLKFLGSSPPGHSSPPPLSPPPSKPHCKDCSCSDQNASVKRLLALVQELRHQVSSD
ncbi:hypothetical protein [Moorena sp. SIO1G6]|uniref:hypothetical protein n=1 Tax=Moorena sp. SIO1G6 TaxID=2607840 RepID=UPI00257D4048|nr:hypothetical protein [Moorena sp. SIO1G6]